MWLVFFSIFEENVDVCCKKNLRMSIPTLEFSSC